MAGVPTLQPEVTIQDIEVFADRLDLQRAAEIYKEHGCLVVRGLMKPYIAELQRDIDRCRAVGAAAHLRKPVKRADLVRALQRVIDPAYVSGTLVRPEPRPPAAPRDVPTGLRVLLVDDNPFNQKVSGMKLERWGHRVRVVASGREALAALAGESFDLMFTDVQMPDMDGFELTAAVRAREAGGPRLPVIAMTAHAMAGDRDKSAAAGMNDHVTKPFEPAQLFEVMLRWLTPALPAPELTAWFTPWMSFQRLIKTTNTISKSWWIGWLTMRRIAAGWPKASSRPLISPTVF